MYSRRWRRYAGVLLVLLFARPGFCQPEAADFPWPDGKRAAVSLSFDDGRASQVRVGTPLFDKYDVDATFYVVPHIAEEALDGWKKAAAEGHEIGNHTIHHPCTGNFAWIRELGIELEDYTLEQMRREMREANRWIKKNLGVTAESFAYPCGHSFVGRGTRTQSYVPLVAELFTIGRGWMDETDNNPGFVDPAQVAGQRMDGQSFEEILPMIQHARKEGRWLVLVGHDIGEKASRFTTDTDMLKALIEYARDPDNGIWLAPVIEVGKYILEQRKKGFDTRGKLKKPDEPAGDKTGAY